MAELSLKATSRTLSTKGAKNKLRKDGFVPGIFYSTEVEPLPICVSEISLKPFVYTSEGHIVSLSIDEKEPQRAIMKEVQFHPITDRIIHFDLLGLTAGHKITVQVPVLLVGAPIGIREGGILQQQLHKIDVECLPKDIPENIKINIADLHIGNSVHVKDLKIENAKIVTNDDVIIVSVDKVRASAESETATAEAGAAKEPEVIGKGKSEEDGE